MPPIDMNPRETVINSSYFTEEKDARNYFPETLGPIAQLGRKGQNAGKWRDFKAHQPTTEVLKIRDRRGVPSQQAYLLAMVKLDRIT